VTIHLVRATVGEWSDRKEWVVAAYTDETMAQTHVELATARAREWEALDFDAAEEWLRVNGDCDSWDPFPWSAYDAGFRVSGDAPRYRVEQVEVRAALPTGVSHGA
jgi:hypothetical protein